MAVHQLSNLAPDGTVMGQSNADLVGFHNVTPIARATVAATTTTVATTTALETDIDAIRTALINKGLIV